MMSHACSAQFAARWLSSCSGRWASTFSVSPVNRYKSIRIDVPIGPDPAGDSYKLIPSFVDHFRHELKDEIGKCKVQGTRGIWLSLPLSTLYLAPVCRELGFALHHCKEDHLLMNMWLLPDVVSTMPRFASHTVGVAGCVLNEEKSEVLVIRDTTRPNIWKFPGGFSDPGENIELTAKREVLEETGISSDFRSVLAFRQHHKMPSSFDMSDIYVVCRMEPLTLDITPCPIEILECRWRTVESLLSDNKLTPLMRRILQLVHHGVKTKNFDSIDINRETFDSVWPGMTYSLFHRSLPGASQDASARTSTVQSR